MKKSRKRTTRLISNPVLMALRRAAPLDAALIDQLRLRELSAIESFSKGRATVVDVELLQELMRMCQCSIDEGIGPEAQGACDSAGELLQQAHAMLMNGCAAAMDPSQIGVLRDLQAFHDLQRAAVSSGEYSRIADLADALTSAE